MEDRQQRRERWKKAVVEWETSGLSAAAWCRKHNLSYDRFLYWRGRFGGQPARFVEVADDGAKSGLVLDCKGFQLHLEKDFDEISLARVIAVLHKLC